MNLRSFVETEKDNPLNDIKKIHDENSLLKTFTEFKNKQKYQKNTDFNIPLDDLYELVAVCCNTDGADADFAGTLLRIRDKKILKLNHNKLFLL